MDEDEIKKIRKALSEKQSRRGATLLRKGEQYANMSKRSSCLVATLSGRVTAEQADIKQSGAAFRDLGADNNEQVLNMEVRSHSQ